MEYPMLHTPSSSRQMLDIFKGYNHNLRIGEGEFFDMRNMTSDYYPVLSPRNPRGVYAKADSLQGLVAKDALCYVDGTAFVINEYRLELGLSVKQEDCPKRLISMGAFVIIMPDRMWVNTLDHTFGNIDAHFDNAESQTAVHFSLCTIEGADYQAVTGTTAPEDPADRSFWIDTSSTPHTLKQYSQDSAMWVPIATTYIKISCTGIGAAFEQFDGVDISGIKIDALQDLNASMVIWKKEEDYIVVMGILDEAVSQPADAGAINIDRRMPNMDFIVEAENRLWGCKYGVADNGQVVNEIYASKLGDFKNWSCFMGIATDSWTGSVGTDGQFTGAITYLGFPVFFKENCLHKVYISAAGAHQIQDTACRGVQKGCDQSLAIVNETLFYKARSGVCSYDGSLPIEVSKALGNVAYSDAVGGVHGNKYYISMVDAAEEWHLFVYDVAKGMWHKEDNMKADCFCSCRGDLYAISDNQILRLTGEKEDTTEQVDWMVQTGEIGLTYPDRKYISRLMLRLSMEAGAAARIYIQYDFCEDWEHLFSMHSTSLRSYTVPIRPKRCDHLRLRIEGVGGVKIYSLTKTLRQGSDVS